MPSPVELRALRPPKRASQFVDRRRETDAVKDKPAVAFLRHVFPRRWSDAEDQIMDGLIDTAANATGA